MTSQLLREAITAVKANNRPKACLLLRDLLADDPTNEMGWIWLSEATSDRSEKLHALEQALAINPARTAVRDRLTQLKEQTEEVMTTEVKAEARLAGVIAQAGEGAFQEARDQLIRMVQKEQNDVEMWLLLSTLVDNIEDKSVALENVLQLEPYHDDAQKLLKLRLQGEVDKLTQGRALEKKGELKAAIVAYETAVIVSPIPGERLIAKERLARLSKLYTPYIQTNPTVTVLRLTAGPPVLYGLLLLVHSGMNPLRVPFLAYLGMLLVIGGTLTWTAVRAASNHPYWDKLPPFVHKNRQLLAVVGFFLSLIPFIILILNTVGRLEIYQTTLQ